MEILIGWIVFAFAAFHIIIGCILSLEYLTMKSNEFPQVSMMVQLKYDWLKCLQILFLWPVVDSELIKKLHDRVLK